MADHLYPPGIEAILTGLGVQQSKHAAVVAMVERAVGACTEQLRARIAHLEQANSNLETALAAQFQRLTAENAGLREDLQIDRALREAAEKEATRLRERVGELETERLSATAERSDLLGRITALHVVANREPENHWRCYYCGEVCRSEVDARNHFGSPPGSEPACQIKAAGEFSLLQALRNAEDQLARYRAEDSDTLRAMYSMQADHVTALRREEEAGYAKGVADMREQQRLLLEALRWLADHCKIEDAMGWPGKVTSDVAPYIFELPAHLAPLIAEAVEKQPWTEPLELQPSPPDPQPVRVYRLDDFTWWAGYSLQSCIEDAARNYDYDAEWSSESARQVTDDEMQRLTFVDENEDGSMDCATTRTFAAELQRRIEAGEQFPQFFASTEY